MSERPEPGTGGVRTSLRGVVAALALAWSTGWYLPVAFALLTLVQAASPVVAAWLTKAVLDAIAGEPAAGYVLGLGLGLAGTGLVATLAPFASRYVIDEISRRVGLLSQDRLFAAVERFTGLARFEDPAFLDRIRLAHQSGGETPTNVTSSVFSVIGAVVTIGGFLVSLLVISPVMALVVLVAALPALFVELRLSRARAGMLWNLGPVERREFFFRDLLSNVQAAKEIRLFGAGPYLRGRMADDRRESNAQNRRMDQRGLSAQSLLGVLSAVVAGGGLVWAVLAAVDGRLTVGDLTLFVAAVGGVQGALTQLVQDITFAHNQLLMFDHYLKVVGTGPDLVVAARPRPVPALRKGIEFREVWFRYSPEHPWVLRDVNLVIPHGGSLGLVGRNGAGKSTFVKLLCRMYDPERGAVLWDGVDLRDMDPAELRRRIGAVFQDYMEYDLTAAENIGLGDVDVLTGDAPGSDSDGGRGLVRAAAEHAGADPIVENLPRGYDTLLTRMFFDVSDDEDDTQLGVPLSGGQWQRLALARAYLRGQRDLLILDEPSSGLDAEAEHEIHTGLRAHRRGRTSLLISHRLGTVREAERIAVLDEGAVVETGSHDELLTQDGLYAHLYRIQARGYQDSAEAVPVQAGEG
ncbi:ABC transporter ATP-binding protein [Nocardiopsis aegyptia]|uniref:ATP-binding cassette subfamily B protein n=1 Tax=Nocardiopsis aegyptia TaxID=220378 RepID=A0A7Z0J7Z4_9ACTN|nr:ABC transporter ATP-binding protein [Nocardiopsis aegyptia]NYJ32538.1 ATP-binding cassette subfamily B protein [Nocardiopsis aegyptia]